MPSSKEKTCIVFYAFFPDLDAGPDWEMAEEEEPQEHAGIPFRYVTYRRRKPHVCG